MIRLTDIHIAYGQNVILEKSDMVITNGKLTALIGESGSGKSSLLYLLGLVFKQGNAKYSFNGEDIHLQDEKQKAQLRRLNIGYVFQDYPLLTDLSIEENFQFIANITGQKLSKEKIVSILKSVHLEALYQQPIDTLSGGERQRLSLALVLSKDPDLILLDEPTSALDDKNTLEMMSIIKEMVLHSNKMIVIASHDEKVWDMCDTIYEIKDKQLVLKRNGNIESDEVNEKGKNKVSVSFYIHYLKQILRKHIKSYALLFLMSVFILALSCTAIHFMKGFNYTLYESVQDSIDKTVYIINGDYDFYVQSAAPFDTALIEEISHYPQVKKIYPYVEYRVDTLENTYLIGYMNDFKLLKYRQMDQVGIYMPESLISQFPVGGNFTIEDYFIECTVVGSIPDVYKNENTSTNGRFIYVPYTLLNTDTLSSEYVVEVESIEDMEALIQQLSNRNITIKSEIDTYYQLEKEFDNIRQIGFLFTGILFIIVLAMITMIYYRKVMNRKFEISLLKINGLTNFHIIQLMLIEIGGQLFMMVFVAYLLQMILIHLLHTFFKQALLFTSIQTLGLLIGLGIILLLPAFIISLKQLLHNDPIELLLS